MGIRTQKQRITSVNFMDVGCTLDVGTLFNLLTYFWWTTINILGNDITISASGPVKYVSDRKILTLQFNTHNLCCIT